MKIFGDQFRKTRMNVALTLMAAAGLMLTAPGETADEFIRDHFPDTEDLVFTNEGTVNDSLTLYQAVRSLGDGASVGAWYKGYDENHDDILQTTEITHFGLWAKNIYASRACDFITAEKNTSGNWNIRKEYHVKDDVVEQSNEKNASTDDMIDLVRRHMPELKRRDPNLRMA